MKNKAVLNYKQHILRLYNCKNYYKVNVQQEFFFSLLISFLTLHTSLVNRFNKKTFL